MAEHRVPKGNIIYIIPTDELFIKYKNNEAFIDEYGRLMNRKPHRVLKELKHYVADSEVQESYASPIKDLVRDNIGELDAESTLAQLTEPMMIERVNALLSENPNLLETDKYILLHSLLGRDLYMEGQLIPIRVAEIKKVAKNNGGF